MSSTHKEDQALGLSEELMKWQKRKGLCTQMVGQLLSEGPFLEVWGLLQVNWEIDELMVMSSTGMRNHPPGEPGWGVSVAFLCGNLIFIPVTSWEALFIVSGICFGQDVFSQKSFSDHG